MRLRSWSLVLVFLSFAASPVLAQTGSLEVWVYAAADRSPLAGATVSLSNEQHLVAVTTALTDEDGRVTFPVLRSGTGYVVQVSLPGFGAQRSSGHRVRSSETERLVFQLSPEQQEVVRVSARSDLIDLGQTSQTTRFSDEFIEELPVPGRFYQNMLSLAPGVNDADEDGNPNVHGARQRDFKAEVGGVSNVDPLTGQWLSFVHPMSIEELEVITAGAGVEFGRAQGGFARILQKQGSNEFEGMLRVLYRTSELDGNGAAKAEEDLVPSFQWLQPSIQISGPIIKDKLWFRLAHERIRGDEPQNLIGAIDVVDRSQNVVADQITWQVSPRNKLAFQYQASDLTLGNYGISSTIPAESSQTLERNGPTYSISWTAPYSPSLLVDSLVAWQDYEQKIAPADTFVYQDCLGFNWPFFSLATARCYSADTGRTSGTFPETSRDKRQRLTVKSNVTLFKNRLLGASHRLKIGFTIEDERFQRELERKPDVHFYTKRTLVDPCPFGGTLPCFQNVGFATGLIHAPEVSSAVATGVNWSVYAEDQLRPAANLSLTIGLRLDREEIDSDGMAPLDPGAEAEEYLSRYSAALNNSVTLAQKYFTGYPDVEQFHAQVAESMGVPTHAIPIGLHAQQNNFWAKKQRKQSIAIRNDNFSPRLSLAWDPRKDGKSKLAFSVGRYYDKIFLAVPLVELEPVSTSLLWHAFRSWFGGYRATTLMKNLNPNVRRQMVDRDLQTPYQDELALSFEHTLWKETSLRVTFIRRAFRDQLQDVDINHLPDDRGRCLKTPLVGEPVVQASHGEGMELSDAYTGEVYIDTDPGPGDGRIDDCSGAVHQVTEIGYQWPPNIETSLAPDGRDDLYVLNPGWGEILLVGNFNSADYTAFVLELLRRRYRNWEMQASYTWADAQGDAEDFDQNLGNERNLREDERGYLDYDQRHVIRVNAATTLRGGFTLGGAVRWESGLPYSILVSSLTQFSVPPEYQNIGDADVKYRFRYPTGQRNDQRNPSFWNVDVMAAKDFALGRSFHFQLSAEIFNLFNDDTILLNDRIDGTNSGLQRFGRRFQIGARFAF
jgi:5-hydroxyisourate hydrolase-like protein (transthyretin family)